MELASFQWFMSTVAQTLGAVSGIIIAVYVMWIGRMRLVQEDTVSKFKVWYEGYKKGLVDTIITYFLQIAYLKFLKKSIPKEEFDDFEKGQLKAQSSYLHKATYSKKMLPKTYDFLAFFKDDISKEEIEDGKKDRSPLDIPVQVLKELIDLKNSYSKAENKSEVNKEIDDYTSNLNDKKEEFKLEASWKVLTHFKCKDVKEFVDKEIDKTQLEDAREELKSDITIEYEMVYEDLMKTRKHYRNSDKEIRKAQQLWIPLLISFITIIVSLFAMMFDETILDWSSWNFNLGFSLGAWEWDWNISYIVMASAGTALGWYFVFLYRVISPRSKREQKKQA